MASKLKQNLKAAPPAFVSAIYQRYVMGVENLTKSYTFFNTQSPLQYWADGRKRFNVFVPPRSKGSKNWKTLYKSALTRNKCLGVIAHVVSMMVSPNIQAQNQNQDEDKALGQFLKDTVEWTQEKEDFSYKLFWAIVTAVAEGTVILRDNYGEMSKVVKEITEVDENGKAKWKSPKTVREYKGAYTEIIPNDELLIPDPFCNEIKEQDWLIRRKRMTYAQAKTRFGHYDNFSQVVAGSVEGWNYTDDYIQSYESVQTLSDNMVEVIEHWDKSTDSYDIVCQGAALTPEGNPNPRPDKQYPFSKSGYEPIDYGFFWYAGLPAKLADEQDVYDAVIRMFIDRQHLNLIKPYLTSNPALVNEDIIVPGLGTYTGMGQKPSDTVTALSVADGGVDAGTMNLLSTMQSNMNTSSLDPMQTGNAPEGGTPTATQAIQMAKNAQIMLGLFGWMIGYLIRQWTVLRTSTILWQMENDVDFSKITMSDKVLASGKLGKRVYMFEKYLTKRSQDEKMQISTMMRDLEKDSNGKMELVAIDPTSLSDISYYVKIDAQPKPKQTDALMQSLAMEKFNVYATRPDVFNLNAAAVALAQAWGDDPDEMVLARAPEAPGVQPMAPGSTPLMSSAKSGPSVTGKVPTRPQIA